MQQLKQQYPAQLTDARIPHCQSGSVNRRSAFHHEFALLPVLVTFEMQEPGQYLKVFKNSEGYAASSLLYL